MDCLKKLAKSFKKNKANTYSIFFLNKRDQERIKSPLQQKASEFRSLSLENMLK